MDLAFVLLLALGLSLDSLAVAVCTAADGPGRFLRGHWGHVVENAVAFGVFQGLLLVAGWLIGNAVQATVAGIDHWIAFALLAGIGIRMMWHSHQTDASRPCASSRSAPLAAMTVASLAFVTSIDAFFAGAGLALEGSGIFLAALVVGAVTFVLTLAGGLGGRRLSQLGKAFQLFGGVALVAIAARVLASHLWP